MKSITGFGLDYESQISKARAQAILGPANPLPRMGYETDVLTVSDAEHPSFKNRLVIQNISGTYMLASPNLKRKDWLRIFGVNP